MIYYQYFLDWKDYASQGRASGPDSYYDRGNPFERKYSENTIIGLNDEFKTDYKKNDDFLIYISKRTSDSIELCIAVNIKRIDLKAIESKINASFPECTITNHREITIEDFKREVDSGRYNSHGVISLLKLDYRGSFFDPYPFDIDEAMYDSGAISKTKCRHRAKQILASKSMNEELDRIYSKKNIKQYYGHPVHYLISAGDWQAAMDMKDLLVSALYSNNRLISGRQTIIRNLRKNAYRDDRYRHIINASEGGIVIIELKCQDDLGMFATDFHELTKATGCILNSQKKDTLFIFVEIIGESMKSDDALSNITSQADIIQITEGTGTLQQAKDYLMELVSKVDFVVDNKEDAFEFLPSLETYSVSDIFNAYNAWYGSGLKNHIYKAYKTKKSYQVEVSPIKSKPYEELQKLVGLTEIKSVIDQIISTGKIRCARERMGLSNEDSSMHMIFTGTPGTAKTTVARLLAMILKDEDIIKSGRFVECGRQDLVAKYVGWTAKTVEDKFKAAQGGVLFIDEAYSLIDDSNTFGAEAINTITQLMENYRNQVIVIFAGYPDKMRDFLSQNEGLRSRIAFHLTFPDYSSAELVDIMKLMCDKRQYTVSDDALISCREFFEKAARVENFGNGRYVRTVLEQAIMRQSNRIITEAIKTGSDPDIDQLCRLETQDFKYVPLGNDTATTKIGFSI